MNRRDALRLLATGAALPLMPGTLLATMREARAVVGTSSTPRTLNAQQDATVKAMTEMILPRTDTPGATDVGASEFVDLVLTEWCDEQQRGRFLSGLAEVDARTQSLFGKDFVGATPAQQAEILTALGEKLLEEVGTRNQGHRPRGSAPRLDESFYSILRRLTLTAYYTSEAGATAELNFQVVPDRYAGCVEVQPTKGVDHQ